METVQLKVDGKDVDLTSCPPNKDHMSCFLSGAEIDQRAICSYCWLYSKLESDHPDARYGRLKTNKEGN